MGADNSPPRDFSFTLIRPPGRQSVFHTLLLDAGPDHLVLQHHIQSVKPLIYQGQEVFNSGYWAIWFLFQDRPWDVGRFYRPDGTWTGYYVDILEPVRWSGQDPPLLEPLVDLFLD